MPDQTVFDDAKNRPLASSVEGISTKSVRSETKQHPQQASKMQQTQKLILMSSLTTLFFLAEIVVGYMVSSLALISDSFHMLSDLIALIIALIAIKVFLLIYMLIFFRR